MEQIKLRHVHKATAKMILDSISPNGHRLQTMQLRYWRPIHSELMTHRKFSRNAGSSRARPSQAIIDQVRENAWGPLHWGKNQSGMQAYEELDLVERDMAQIGWQGAALRAARSAQELLDLGCHKQIVNRILEPYTYIDVLVSSTEYNNWFALRDDDAADPTIRQLAKVMRQASDASKPKLLKNGEWHLPYIREEDWIDAERYLRENRVTRDLPRKTEILRLIIKISTARCARISYAAFDGASGSITKDLDLFEKLLINKPVHASPAEHQARPDTHSSYEVIRGSADEHNPYGNEVPKWDHPALHGNFTGWIQHRKTIENEYIPG